MVYVTSGHSASSYQYMSYKEQKAEPAGSEFVEYHVPAIIREVYEQMNLVLNCAGSVDV